VTCNLALAGIWTIPACQMGTMNAHQGKPDKKTASIVVESSVLSLL